MADAATTTTSRVSRCAVCKIDRKGRFVYLDDETEKLLGLSQVELFAKPFSEFLDPADHTVIDEITSQFNRYESFYDAAPVTIIDSQGHRLAATVVVSLNFAAGNPVNYEIIINTAGQVQPSENHAAEIDDSRLFLEFLKDVESPSGSPRGATAIAEALRKYTGAQAVALYENSEEASKLIASAGHRLEDSTDAANNETAAEKAPSNTYSTLLELAEGEEYSLKVTFDDAWSSDRFERARQRAELASSVLARTLVIPRDAEPVYNSADTFSLIELLDKMHIGAALFDAEGHLVDHNQKLRHLLPMDTVTGLDEFARKLAEAGAKETEAHFTAWMEAGDEAANPPHLELPVTLSSGCTANLAVFRLAPGTKDRSAYCTLAPLESCRREGAREPLPLSRRFIREAIERLQSSVSAGLSVFQKIDHEYRGQLERDGSFQLNCLNNHLLKTRAILKKLNLAARFAMEPEPPRPTDLDLLVDQVASEVSQDHPQVKLSLNKSNLPRISLSRKKLKGVLKNILTHLVANAAGGKVGLNISAAVNAKECNLRIKCEGTAVPQKYLEHSFDPAGLGVTRELLATMGGQLELVKSHGRGSVLTLSLPTKEV